MVCEFAGWVCGGIGDRQPFSLRRFVGTRGEWGEKGSQSLGLRRWGCGRIGESLLAWICGGIGDRQPFSLRRFVGTRDEWGEKGSQSLGLRRWGLRGWVCGRWGEKGGLFLGLEELA